MARVLESGNTSTLHTNEMRLRRQLAPEKPVSALIEGRQNIIEAIRKHQNIGPGHRKWLNK